MLETLRHARTLPPRVLWVWGAAALGLIVAIFFVVQGVRWMNVRDELGALERQQLAPRDGVGSSGLDETARQTRLRAEEARVEAAEAALGRWSSDTLVERVARAATESAIALHSVNLGDSEFVTQKGIRYQTHRVLLTVQGDSEAIQRYLSVLQERLPAAAITEVRITGGSGLSLARLQLLVYSDPERAHPAPTPRPATTPEKG